MKTSFLAWRRRVAAIAAASLILILSACVGGGSVGPIAEGGIGGTGISFGPVTGFGSVFVNGTAFDTNDAVILIDGASATEADLTEGMLVRVEGEWTDTGTGTADRIEYRSDIRGPVQTVVNFDPLTGSGTLTVLGQTVRFNKQTVFRGVTREAIAVDDDLVISGWYLDSGEFLASLVRASGIFLDGGEAEVKGIIEELNLDARSFRVGGLDVLYSRTTEIEMQEDRDELLPSDNGAFVEVEGAFNGSVLLANEIEQEDDRNLLQASGGDDVEIEGPISSGITSNRTFTLNGTTVQVTEGTEFDDGLRESDLQAGLQVSVEGEWDARDVLVAEEIESRSADSDVKASILDIDPGARELNVGGVQVRVTSRTLIVDEDDDDRLSFSKLQVGETVEVDGIRREDSDNVLLEAIKIEREDDDDDIDGFELTGRVDAVDVSALQFNVLGLALTVTSDTEWDDVLDEFDDLQPGTRVELEYKQCAAGFCALEVEGEDD